MAMVIKEQQETGSFSVQLVLSGTTELRSVRVYLDSGMPRKDGGSEHQMVVHPASDEGSPIVEADEELPKYACSHCGSDEVRGDFDTYPVYRTEGDRLIHLRTECPDPSVMALYCTNCHEPIEIEDLSGLKIE